MPTSRILLAGYLPDAALETLRKHYTILRFEDAIDPSVEVVVTDDARGAPTDVIKMLPNLKLIAVNGVGTKASPARRCPCPLRRLGTGRSLPPRHLAFGKALGIFWLGQIGQAIARRAEAFGMTVCYFNRTERTDVSWARTRAEHALAF